MLDCKGSVAGRGHDYHKEMYVARKPISPSKDHRKEDRKEYKVSGTSTLHLAAPSVVCLRQQRAAQDELFRLATRWC